MLRPDAGDGFKAIMSAQLKKSQKVLSKIRDIAPSASQLQQHQQVWVCTKCEQTRPVEKKAGKSNYMPPVICADPECGGKAFKLDRLEGPKNP